MSTVGIGAAISIRDIGICNTGAVRWRRRLFKCLDYRVEIHLERLIMMQDWRYLALDVEQRGDRHLGRPHRIFDGENDIIRDFDELADERQIL